jgi:hypothetical protein
MDFNVIYLSNLEFSLVGDDEVVEMSFGPCEAVFQKPKDTENHLKPLYIRGILMAHLSPGCSLMEEL